MSRTACDGLLLGHAAQQHLSPFRHCVPPGLLPPRQVHNCLGVLQWYDLLVRCKLSVYDSIYAFVRRDGEHIEQSIPHQVMSELLMSAFLAVYWSVDITRPFLPLLCASDASTDFGLGGSVVKLPIEQIREMARWAEKRGAFVVLDGGERMEDYVGRLGEPHLLDIPSEVFTHVFSIKCKHPAHINILEGHGFLVRLRWILRSRKRHSTRIVVLLDSAVWLGAASKGRSSRSLNRLSRKAAALELAGDLQVNLILVPSSENPSDIPSRGIRPRPKESSCTRKRNSAERTRTQLHVSSANSDSE